MLDDSNTQSKEREVAQNINSLNRRPTDLRTNARPGRYMIRSQNRKRRVCIGLLLMVKREMAIQRPRRFAPLASSNASSTSTKLQGIVFDVDGTLWYVHFNKLYDRFLS